ncbi:putative non-specific serine/threonine protein kinase [Helianthus anomalus]
MKIIVDVIQARHSLGVIHHDLKPGNFLLINTDEDFLLKAIDFRRIDIDPNESFRGVCNSFRCGKQETEYENS